jgi:pilus assembly protein CpaC
MHTMKANWIGLGTHQTRSIGLMLAVLIGVSSYAGAQESKSAAQSMGDVSVFVGESARIDVEEATTVALADPSIADHQIPSKKEILINGKKPGVTTLNVYEASGARKTYRIVVTEGDFQSKAVREAINLPGVTARVVGNSVIVEGTVANDRELERALTIAGSYREKVVNLIEVSNPVQVRIRMKVAEVSLTALKNKGLEYPDSITYSMDMIKVNELSGGSSFTTIFGGFSSSQGSTVEDPNEIDAGIWARINLLQRNGDLSVLAEPTLVTLSGKEASFLAGGEYPVVIALQDSFSVEYKEFGVKMKIKPVVDSKENINTSINAELSAIDPTLTVSSSTTIGGVSVPGLVSRKASSTLQLKNGQTIMIGGLLDKQTIKTLKKVPWIGNVPVLGLLFTNKGDDQRERELMFLATFDLVRNPDAEAKAAPVSSSMKELLSAPMMIKSEEEWKKANGNQGN